MVPTPCTCHSSERRELKCVVLPSIWITNPPRLVLPTPSPSSWRQTPVGKLTPPGACFLEMVGISPAKSDSSPWGVQRLWGETALTPLLHRADETAGAWLVHLGQENRRLCASLSYSDLGDRFRRFCKQPTWQTPSVFCAWPVPSLAEGYPRRRKGTGRGLTPPRFTHDGCPQGGCISKRGVQRHTSNLPWRVLASCVHPHPRSLFPVGADGLSCGRDEAFFDPLLGARVESSS